MTFLHILKRSSSAWAAALLLMAAPSCLLAQNATLTDSIPVCERRVAYV